MAIAASLRLTICCSWEKILSKSYSERSPLATTVAFCDERGPVDEAASDHSEGIFGLSSQSRAAYLTHFSCFLSPPTAHSLSNLLSFFFKQQVFTLFFSHLFCSSQLRTRRQCCRLPRVFCFRQSTRNRETQIENETKQLMNRRVKQPPVQYFFVALSVPIVPRKSTK